MIYICNSLKSIIMGVESKKVFCVAGAIIAFILSAVIADAMPSFVALGCFVGVVLSFFSGFYFKKLSDSVIINDYANKVKTLEDKLSSTKVKSTKK